MLQAWEHLIQYDTGILKALPLWAAILFLAVWLLPVGVCLFQDQKGLFSRFGQSRNTVHTAFWLAVMMLLPGIGSLLYLAASLLPYCLWQRRHGQREFPWCIRLRRRQLPSLCLSILVPAVLLLVLSGSTQNTAVRSFLTRYDWCYEVSFLCWVSMIGSDWLLSIYRRAVYLQLPESDPPVQTGELLGVPYFRAEGTRITAPGVLHREAVRLRQMADAAFRQHPYNEELPGTSCRIYRDGQEERFRIIGTKQKWLGDAPDFMEMRYIGLGITRCRVCTWHERAGKLRCTESVLYRAVPRLTGWICRAGILLTVQFAGSSPRAVELHTAVMGLLSHLG